MRFYCFFFIPDRAGRKFPTPGNKQATWLGRLFTESWLVSLPSENRSQWGKRLRAKINLIVINRFYKIIIMEILSLDGQLVESNLIRIYWIFE